MRFISKKVSRFISVLLSLILMCACILIPGEDSFALTILNQPVQNETVIKSNVWKRLYGPGRYETMKAIVNEGFAKTGGVVVIATGAGFKDALAASGFAGVHNAPVILTDGKNLSSSAEDVLSKLSPSKIYVAGGTAVITENVMSQIKNATGVSPKRLAGANSAATSAKLATEGKGYWKDSTAIIATNKSFKDALSVAPIAYAKKYPILLADNGKSLSNDVLKAMKSIGIKQVIIVGGTGAVTSNVEKQLKDNGISIKKRLWGYNGVATSKEIARWGLNNGMSANKMGVATSQNFPDALAGAALCGYNNSVLILADDKAINNAVFPSGYRSYIDRAYVFGGTSAVGVKTWNALVSWKTSVKLDVVWVVKPTSTYSDIGELVVTHVPDYYYRVYGNPFYNYQGYPQQWQDAHVINSKNEVVKEYKYNPGAIAVKQNDVWGIMNMDGQILYSPSVKKRLLFGFAEAPISGEGHPWVQGISFISKEGDRDADVWILSKDFKTIHAKVKLPTVGIRGMAIELKNVKGTLYGGIDGKEVIDKSIKGIRGSLIYSYSSIEVGGNPIGSIYIDRNGNLIKQSVYHVNKSGFVSANDYYVASKRFEKSNSCENLAIANVNTGKPITDFIYEDALYFVDGYCPVKRNGKWGFININGDEVTGMIFDKVSSVYKGKAAVIIDGKFAIINLAQTLNNYCGYIDRID